MEQQTQPKQRRNEVMSVLRFFYDITFHPNLKGIERALAIIVTAHFCVALSLTTFKLCGLGFIFGI
jgi:hypothetical protein